MLKGIISSIDTSSETAKVTFPTRDNIVSSDLKIADHIPIVGEEMLLPGDIVIVAFFSNTFSDGAIIARI